MDLYFDNLSNIRRDWIMVTHPTFWVKGDADWLASNMRGKYQCLGYYWYFELPEDAALFKLTWS